MADHHDKLTANDYKSVAVNNTEKPTEAEKKRIKIDHTTPGNNGLISVTINEDGNQVFTCRPSKEKSALIGKSKMNIVTVNNLLVRQPGAVNVKPFQKASPIIFIIIHTHNIR